MPASEYVMSARTPTSRGAGCEAHKSGSVTSWGRAISPGYSTTEDRRYVRSYVEPARSSRQRAEAGKRQGKPKPNRIKFAEKSIITNICKCPLSIKRSMGSVWQLGCRHLGAWRLETNRNGRVWRFLTGQLRGTRGFAYLANEYTVITGSVPVCVESAFAG